MMNQGDATVKDRKLVLRRLIKLSTGVLFTQYFSMLEKINQMMSPYLTGSQPFPTELISADNADIFSGTSVFLCKRYWTKANEASNKIFL